MGTDPELFFPLAGMDARPALSVCREVCPVRAQCLEYALETGQVDGIWGGVRQDRLREMLQERRKARRVS